MNDTMLPVELRSHEECINVLKRIKPVAHYVELVQIDDDAPDPVIVHALSHLILKRKHKTNQWLGTIRGGAGATKYTFQIDESYWSYLQKLSSLFFTKPVSEGLDGVKRIAFGLTDIAFLDKGGHTLFFTITHEGYACIKSGL